MPGEEDTSTGRRGPRPRGEVRAALVQAGVELARAGGPDAVVLREVTRMVGVVPNAAYRHFADRESLLAAVRDEAVMGLSRRMAEGKAKVRAGAHTPTGARLRLQATGKAYLAFAREEPGLFDTAFSASDRPSGDGLDGPLPLEHLQTALDDLVAAGVLDARRRPGLEFPIWSTVHGLATLLRGPLSALPAPEQERLERHTLDFVWASLV